MSQHTRPKKSTQAPNPTPAAATGPTVAKRKAGQPASDHIRIRAYEIFQARNGGPGNALADWIRAEQEDKTRRDTEI